MGITAQQAGFLRLPQVLALIPVCPATWWAGCRNGRFPKPIKLSPRVTVWRAADIAAYLEKMSAQGENSAEAGHG
jgi:predicted DNA-binding transcriptional regulator AlpA